MRRSLRTAVAAVVFVAASAALAQNPQGNQTNLYPLKPGNKWTYKVGEATIVVQVAAADANGITLETKVNDRVVASEVIQVKPDGIYRAKINKSAIEPAVKILELKDGQPAAKGTSWTVEAKIVDQPVKGKFTIKDDAEVVKVPAGEFKTVMVDGSDFEIAGTKAGVKYWFAADKGIVQLSYSIAGNDAKLELKEFAEGK